jgi:hypothetical protein
MCNGLNHKPECVFLSACFAETVSDAFVSVGIPHIVTVTNERVLDKASLAFTDTFYSALLGGKPVSESFNLGIARLVAQHPTERVKFDLRGRGDHGKPIFYITESVPRPLVDATTRLPESQCHAPAMFSVGRFVEVQQVDYPLSHLLHSIGLWITPQRDEARQHHRTTRDRQDRGRLESRRICEGEICIFSAAIC